MFGRAAVDRITADGLQGTARQTMIFWWGEAAARLDCLLAPQTALASVSQTPAPDGVLVHAEQNPHHSVLVCSVTPAVNHTSLHRMFSAYMP